jgi:two-component system sensor histidine kinase YesM
MVIWRWFRSGWMPGKLKHRIFLAFVIFILVPFACIQVYQFWKIERLMEQSISRMNETYLEQIVKAFENLKTNVLMSMLTLEKDKNIESILRTPGQYEDLQRKSIVQDRFKVMQSFVPSSNYVYFVMLDNYGGLYTSFGQESVGLYDDIARERGFTELEQSSGSYQWLLDQTERMPANSGALSLYSLAKDSTGKSFGKYRISINYQEWFRSSVKEFSSGQNYFVVSRSGEIIANSRSGTRLTPEMVRYLTSGRTGDYFIDNTTSSIVNIRSIPSMDWYLVSQFPLDMFFGDLLAAHYNRICHHVLRDIVQRHPST